jgi:hypothetical protein
MAEAKKKEPSKKEPSPLDRAPRQENSDRNPVKSAEQTQNIPTEHGAIK